MDSKIVFPKLKKKISNFVNDEEGTILRSKAAAVGPMAVGALVLMSKEMSIEVQASKFSSHMSHMSHSSVTTNNTTHSSHSNTMPAHSSHSSGSTSGFSHTAGTFTLEARSAENN